MNSKLATARMLPTALLAVFFAISALAATEKVNGVTWTYSVSGGAATVSKANPAKGALTVPSVLGGVPVKNIRNGGLTGFFIVDGAFAFCTNLTSVTIPASVTNIGDFAFFACSKLSRVTIGKGVKRIGQGAFNHCTGLTKVAIPAGVKTIGRIAFDDCPKLASVAISDGVTSLGDGAFSECTGLKSVTIGKGLKTIAADAFAACPKLTAVTIPGTVKGIGNGAFAECTGLASVTIPASVADIGDRAFSECTGLKSVAIGKGVKTIGDNAFSGCVQLAQVAIPDGVATIGTGAFAWCTDLAAIQVGAGNARYTSENGVLFDKAKTTLLQCPGRKSGAYAIPNGVTAIGSQAFSGCGGLTGVAIPAGVRRIGDEAFSGCAELREAALPGSVVRLGANAFSGCKVLEEAAIPGGVQRIGEGAFSDCEGLRAVAIGHGVKDIGAHAFSGCGGLAGVDIPSGVANIGDYAFSSCGGLARVAIPAGVTNIGLYAFSHCGNLNEVSIPDSVAIVGSFAFKGCGAALFDTTRIPGVRLVDGWAVDNDGSLSGVLDLAGVRGVGGSSFCFCTRLTGVKIPAGVKSIGNSAFYGCSGLTNVAIPASVAFIENSVFNGCGKLASVSIPAGVKRIGDYAFRNCTGLKSVMIPDKVESIGDYAFDGCTGLARVTIGKGVARIGSQAFAGCPAKLYDKKTIPGVTCVDRWVVDVPATISGTLNLAGARGIADYAFCSCTKLVRVSIPEGVKAIGESTFLDCTSLKSVTIPRSVTSIGNSAFGNCGALAAVSIPGGVKSIGSKAFADCAKLAKITVPGGVQHIGDGAFAGCTGLTRATIGKGASDLGARAFEGCKKLKILSVPSAWKGTDELADAGVPIGCRVVYGMWVAFDVAGGTCAEAGRTYETGAVFGQLPTPTLSGRCFGGWWTGTNGTGTRVTADTVVQIGHDTLFAKWTGKNYTVVFNANGGKGKMKKQSVRRDAAVRLAANQFTKSGHVFAGWSRTPKGKIAYADAAKVKNLAAAGGKATLYAKWAKSKYAVAFNANGGKGKMPKQKMAYGKAAKLRKNAFKRKGYTFLGWSKTKKGTVAYKNGAKVKNLRTDGKTTALYAKWKSAFQVLGNKLSPGKKVEFTLALDREGLEALADNGGITQAKIGLWVPEDFNPARTWNVLLVSAGSSVSGMGAYVEAAKSAGGWIVMGAEGASEPLADDVTYRWTTMRTGLEALGAEWPAAKKWPVATGGFSGGAKWSGLMGGKLQANGYPLAGMWMGGCNEDMATMAFVYYVPGEEFLDVPIFLSGGDSDPTAPPAEVQAVRDSMQRTGFKNIRMKSYSGGHSLYSPHVEEGLRWFVGQAGGSKSAAAVQDAARSTKGTPRKVAAGATGTMPWAEVTTSDRADGSAVADGDESTGWTPEETKAGAWVVLAFAKVRDVAEVEVVGENLPEEMRVLLSEDAEAWREEVPGLARYVWVAFPEGAERVDLREVRVVGAE